MAPLKRSVPVSALETSAEALSSLPGSEVVARHGGGDDDDDDDGGGGDDDDVLKDIYFQKNIFKMYLLRYIF